MAFQIHRSARLFAAWQLTALSAVVGCGGSNNFVGSTSPTPTYTVSPSATSLTFAATVVGTTSSQSLTLTNTGNATVTVSGVTLSGIGAASFSETTNCASLAAGTGCVTLVSFRPTAPGVVAATLTFADNASGAPQQIALTGTGTGAAATLSDSVSASSLTFAATATLTSAAQSVTLTNTGTGALTLSAPTISGTNATLFGYYGNCSTTLAAGASCTTNITFSPAASGTFAGTLTFNSNAANGPLTVALAGTGSGVAQPGQTADCSVNGGTCGAATTIVNDPIAAGGFHGYADPSLRKDPNAGIDYLAYSWAKTLADGTHVVDLHLAASTDSGKTFTLLGPLYQSTQTSQTTSSAYSSVNDSSTETIDLLPIPLTGTSIGQTLWVQAHQSYLVAPQGGIYDQLNATNLISVTAVQVASPANAGTALLGLSTAPEARLSAVSTDPNRGATQNLTSLSTSTAKCGNWGQPALWYQAPNLYLALECTEITGNGNIDANELAHFLYVTTPTGADASKWVWTFAAEFATAAQAGKFGALPSEGVAYQFFTEPEFVQSQSGQLLLIATPSIFSPAGSQQPVIQYGCRTIPVTSLSPTGISLATDATTGAVVTTSKITEADLYVSPNEGPAACTYEPTATNGVIIGRKYENDPKLGFYIYPVNTGIFP